MRTLTPTARSTSSQRHAYSACPDNTTTNEPMYNHAGTAPSAFQNRGHSKFRKSRAASAAVSSSCSAKQRRLSDIPPHDAPAPLVGATPEQDPQYPPEPDIPYGRQDRG